MDYTVHEVLQGGILGWVAYLWVGKIPWRREQLPTPVFWPGEFQGLQLDTTEQLSNQ